MHLEEERERALAAAFGGAAGRVLEPKANQR